MNNDAQLLVNEILSMRVEALRRQMNSDPRRNYDTEFGYPDDVTAEECGRLFERGDIAGRIVSVFPEECWSRRPEVYESVEHRSTEFEKAWKDLVDTKNFLWYLQQVDILSGIGSFGVLLLGIDDGQTLETPVKGIDLKTGLGNGKEKKSQLLYCRAFDERYVTIDKFEDDLTSPRYGMPVMYTIKFTDPSTYATGETKTTTTIDKKVHWTRIIHVADNLISSEVIGVPRMKPVWNRLQDILKTAGGSAEMFWKGAFPGISFETLPDIAPGELDVESIKDEFAKYSNGLQRFLALNGVTAKSLPVQVADPTPHINMQIMLIAIRMGVPARVLMGSEVGALASAQDTKRWNERLAKRQNEYLTPRLVRLVVDRLMAIGVLPKVKMYIVEWPDMNVPTSIEKGTVAMKKTQAMSAYTSGGVSDLIAPEDYLIRVLELPTEEAKTIVKKAKEFKKQNGGMPLGMPKTPQVNPETGGKPSSKKMIEPKSPKSNG